MGNENADEESSNRDNNFKSYFMQTASHHATQWVPLSPSHRVWRICTAVTGCSVRNKFWDGLQTPRARLALRLCACQSMSASSSPSIEVVRMSEHECIELA